MSDVQLTNEYNDNYKSFSGWFVGFVFFIVLSQVFILRTPDIVTQVFRPIIVVALFINMQKKHIVFNNPESIIGFLAAIWCAVVFLMYPYDPDAFKSAAAIVLYLLMFSAVSSTVWNKKETSAIIFACFAGAVLCALVFMYSNPMTDFSGEANGDINMLGVHANRNKNAYAFSLGTVIGLQFLFKSNKRKFVIFIATAIELYCVLYSQCRGAFFCCVAGMIIVIWEQLNIMRKKGKIAKFAFWLVFTIIIFAAAYVLIKNSELSRLIDTDSKSGRDNCIEHAWELFLGCDVKNKIIGNGYLFERQNTVGLGVHVVYLTYLLSTGIIGATLIALIFVCTGLRIRGCASYSLFVIAFMRTFFEGLDYYIFIPLILSIIIHNYSKTHGGSSNELFGGKTNKQRN